MWYIFVIRVQINVTRFVLVCVRVALNWSNNNKICVLYNSFSTTNNSLSIIFFFWQIFRFIQEASNAEKAALLLWLTPARNVVWPNCRTTQLGRNKKKTTIERNTAQWLISTKYGKREKKNSLAGLRRKIISRLTLCEKKICLKIGEINTYGRRLGCMCEGWFH